MSKIITPENIREQQRLMAAMGQRNNHYSAPPDIDEVMSALESRLDQAATYDLSKQASVKTYVAFRNALVAAGLPKDVVIDIISNIKISVTDNFVNSTRFDSVLTKEAGVLSRLYEVMKTEFGEDAKAMMRVMVVDRFDIIIPI